MKVWVFDMVKIKRIVAFIIDIFIVSFLSFIPFFIGMIVLFWNKGELTGYGLLLANIYYISSYVFIVCKDLKYENASIGKHLLMIEVVTNDKKTPKKSKLILRNILCVLWPINLLIMLICGKKLEDFIFETEVVNSNKLEIKQKQRAKKELKRLKKIQKRSFQKMASIILYIAAFLWGMLLIDYENDDVWFIGFLVLFSLATFFLISHIIKKIKNKLRK